MNPTAKKINVALLGNPNAGKSTLFNALTGLNQKTGNYAGVTVDKLEGFYKHANLSVSYHVSVIDLPGTYSLFYKSLDEEVAVKSLLSTSERIDVVVVVIDAANLKRNLLLATQALDLGLKTVVALNMFDEAKSQKILIDVEKLSSLLGVAVIPIDSKHKTGIEELKNAITIAQFSDAKFYDLKTPDSFLEKFKAQFSNSDKENSQSWEEEDKLYRFKNINYIITSCVKTPKQLKLKALSSKIDSVLTHPILGYAVFIFILFIIFQFIFFVAEGPMNWIESGFITLGGIVSSALPSGILSDLFTEGVLAGVGGVLMFVPQIAFLFVFIALLEDSGYMARASFIMDKLLRKFGLNGRSVIPIISATACAVPSIMSTRSIANFKERLITIFVLPLISCSARLPVYTLLISMMFPDTTILGFLNLKGLVLFGLYMLGFLFTLLTALVLKRLLKTKEASYFLMEMPIYRVPYFKNVAITVLNKIKVFVFDAGKIIVAISIVLWFMSNYGPGDKMAELETEKFHLSEAGQLTPELSKHIETLKLENSFVGYLGKGIEPVIRPLGFDWKIGIAIITSFAAREVFVGTMATIYGSDENEVGIKEKLMNEKDAQGNLKYTLPVCFSLVIFYVFALQCMSTIAVVKRETKGWKWPAIQFIYLTTLAYLGAWITFIMLK